MTKLPVKTTKAVIPMIYAYATPEVKRHIGWSKIGYTEQDVETRIQQQTHTADIRFDLLWKGTAIYDDGSGDVFTDKDFHVYLRKNFEGYTQTFIGIGAFECQSEAENALKYVKTKFTRTMLHVLKVTQDNNRDVWKYVPIQDFSKRTDIDWSVSVSAIDQQLYKKYGLTGEEISFIETHVKEMA